MHYSFYYFELIIDRYYINFSCNVGGGITLHEEACGFACISLQT